MQSKWVKNKEEIENICKGQHIVDEVYQNILEWIQEGYTEKYVVEYIKKRFMELGGEKEAFDTIVAFGSNAAEPHHVASDRALKKNEFVLVDMGVVVGGMCSDFTRTFFFGDEIGEEEVKVYNIVKDAQEIGLKCVKDKMLAKDVDGVVREEIASKGYGEYFVHGTGHGVGKEIHEYPRLGKGSDDVVENGMVVTIEPGIYVKGKIGVRIEDMVIVGNNERMSKHNTDLIKIVR